MAGLQWQVELRMRAAERLCVAVLRCIHLLSASAGLLQSGWRPVPRGRAPPAATQTCIYPPPGVPLSWGLTGVHLHDAAISQHHLQSYHVVTAQAQEAAKQAKAASLGGGAEEGRARVSNRGAGPLRGSHLREGKAGLEALTCSLHPCIHSHAARAAAVQQTAACARSIHTNPSCSVLPPIRTGSLPVQQHQPRPSPS